jgi:hypothetical protein
MKPRSKVEVRPFQLEHFAAPHARIQGTEHHLPGHWMLVGIDGFQ